VNGGLRSVAAAAAELDVDVDVEVDVTAEAEAEAGRAGDGMAMASSSSLSRFPLSTLLDMIYNRNPSATCSSSSSERKKTYADKIETEIDIGRRQSG